MSIVYRIVDANLNRAREGLRVVEELVRLGLSDRRLTARCRLMRHTLALYPEKVPGGYPALLAARDGKTDVGAPLWPEEATRQGLLQLAAANLKRTQEALRVLEEYAKLASWPVAELKALRFAAYDLEKTIILSFAAAAGPNGSGAAEGRRRRRVGRMVVKERCRR